MDKMQLNQETNTYQGILENGLMVDVQADDFEAAQAKGDFDVSEPGNWKIGMDGVDIIQVRSERELADYQFAARKPKRLSDAERWDSWA